MKEVREVKEIVFRKDLYPRMQTDPVAVQRYANDLAVLPPIEINQDNELIDGWHRWTAHKKANGETIFVTVTKTKNDGHFLELAIQRNAKHGLQLSLADKQDMARKIYTATPVAEQGEKKKTLAKILSVDIRTVQDWLSRTDKDNKERRDAEVFALWLACHTQQQIAEAVGMTQKGVDKVLELNESFRLVLEPNLFSEIKDEDKRWQAIAEHNRSHAEHAADFTPPLYNVWKQQTKSGGASHFGNSEVRWLDNLLYLYTKPFDIIVDPFAGGGSTIELCRKRFRRYLVSDRVPIVEREHEIHKHDVVTQGLLKPPEWKAVKLVYLDPPYWKQSEGKYSKDASDLANMTLDDFTKHLAGVIRSFARKITDAYIALIIQPTQWNAPERQYTDHVADMLRAVKLPIEMRYSVPYESQQCNAQMVEWAKVEKRCLVLTREIIVWRVP